MNQDHEKLPEKRSLYTSVLHDADLCTIFSVENPIQILYFFKEHTYESLWYDAFQSTK